MAFDISPLPGCMLATGGAVIQMALPARSATLAGSRERPGQPWIDAVEGTGIDAPGGYSPVFLAVTILTIAGVTGRAICGERP
jgi:hypothetical protein